MAPMKPSASVASEDALGGWTIPRRGDARRRRPGLPRIDRSELAIWFREIDRMLLALILALVVIGVIAVAAASPAAARRLSTAATKLHDLHFLRLHLQWLAVGLPALFITSLLPKDVARRVAVVMFAAMLAALFAVPVLGSTVNGAKRWLDLGFSFQPSEFLKPAFAVFMAWILSWRVRDPNLPVISLSFCLMLLIGILLMMQPDFGSTVLFSGVWFIMVLLSGLSIRMVAISLIGAIIAVVLAYYFYPVATARINGFFAGPSAFDQVGLARRTLLAGGWLGSGLWLGTRKLSLPEAQTDYIFSVIGEEFGLLVCAAVVVIYLAIIGRVLLRLVREDDLFTMLAATGLAVQFGGQAVINIAVNLQLFPSKGMTLPLISYGGSSLIALCITVGFLLAITRRNPYITRSRFALKQGQTPLLQDLR